MPGQIPNTVYAFRIVHIDNVEYLLTNGMFRRDHAQTDPNYISIGDSSLIASRNDYPVNINPPGGTLGEYVPFYFGPLSPMLLRIKDGRGVTQRPQSDIVYIVCKIGQLIEHCNEWCFTDGHAKDKLTDFFNNLDNLNEVDWNMVFERFWMNTDEDFDRMRRKQAEFLVRYHVPVGCISGVIVFNQQSSNFVQEIVGRLGLQIPVRINPNNQFYYG
jgi:hypothetical protein